MNNGIYSLGQTTIDSRALTPVRPNNTIRSVEQILSFPKGNNLFEGYYADDSYVMVIDTTVNNNLNVSVGLVLQNGGFISIDWGDGSVGGVVIGTNMQRNGSFETNFICGGTNPFTVSHNYSTHGIYVVRITGRATGFGSRASLGHNSPNITHVLSFGQNNGLNICLLQLNSNLIYVPPNRPPQHLGNYADNGGMFIGCTKFNHPNISQWNLNNNTNFNSMFTSCSSLNQPISNVIVNANTSCNTMFGACSSLNSSLSNWTFNGNNDCSSMFANCVNFTGSGLDTWTTSGITNANQMFINDREFNTNIGSWNTSNITNMYRMLFGCSKFNQPLSTWNTAKVTNMVDVFNTAVSFNQSLDGWDVRKATNFQTMFASCTGFNGSLSGWQPGILTAGASCPDMFNNCTSFEGSGLDSWTTSGIITMGGMFATCNKMPAPVLNNWDTSNNTSLSRTFYRCNKGFSATAADLSNWNINKVTTFTYAFSESTHKTTIHNWNIPSGANCQYMFYFHDYRGSLSGWKFLGNNNCENLFNYNLANGFSGVGLDTWDTSGIVSANGMFSSCNSINPNVSGWNTASITGMNGMFYHGFSFRYNFAGSGLENWNTGKVTNMANMFRAGYPNNTAFNPSGIDNWNVTGVVDMNYMFGNQTTMNRISLTGWNICNVTNISNFMNGCNIGSGNYSNLLISWNNNKASGVNGVKNWATNLTPHFGSAKYTSSASGARASLISYGWTITDGGAA